MSVTQLKSVFSFRNFYNRSRSNYLEFVYIENDIETKKFYEIKAIIDKRIKKFDKISIIKYKIK